MTQRYRRLNSFSKEEKAKRILEIGGHLKTVLLKIAAAAAGITLALCIAAACVFWYVMRPKPQKPWNAAALTASQPPSFAAYGKELHIYLRYDVQNHTSNDYSIGKSNHLRLMGRYPSGSLTTPLEDDDISIEGPVFIPAQHTGMMTLQFKAVIPVAKEAKQSDEDYHEQLRFLLNKTSGSLDGFTVFDEDNRYQINLPRWNTSKPSEATPVAIGGAADDDCYDASGNLLPNEFAAFGGALTSCGAGHTRKPKSQRAQVPALWRVWVEQREACDKAVVDSGHATKEAFDACRAKAEANRPKAPYTR